MGREEKPVFGRNEYAYLAMLSFGTLVFLGLVGFGLIQLDTLPSVASHTASQPTAVAPPPAGQGSGAAGGWQWSWKRLSLDPSQFWPSTLAKAIALGFISVSIFELLRFASRRILYTRDRRNRMIDEFFGTDASTRTSEGEIVLQADFVDKFVKETKTDFNTLPKNRMFKARNFINRWDAQGAREVGMIFRVEYLDAPDYVFGATKTSELIDPGKDCPFRFCMGLGFHTATMGHIDKFWGGILKVQVDNQYGDVVIVRTEKWKLDDAPSKITKTFSKDNEWITLTPNEWDVISWNTRKTSDGKKGVDLYDYAIILRRATKEGGKVRTEFVLAGFTEVGTAAAGFYMRRNWEQMYRDYVRRDPDNGSFGIIICGPSDSEKFDEWKEYGTWRMTP